MESELYEAAVNGDRPSLLDLLGKDVLLLDRIMVGNCTETPLHVAAMLRHLGFVEEIVARKPELTKELDSQSLTPLHLVTAKGHHNIVAALLRVSPKTCYVYDKYERNPLQVAAMKGHVGAMELLARVRLDAARCVSENGQMILHLTMKHNRLEALEFLIGLLADDQFMNLADTNGNTILHLAAVDKQTKIINLLTDIPASQILEVSQHLPY